MSGIVIGGRTAWKVRSKGELGIAFHWVNEEPSMVFYPLRRGMKLVGAMPYVLPLSAAHDLVAEGSKGEEIDVEALMSKCTRAAEVMGYGGDRAMTHLIADAMLDGLDDLCDMPPAPPAAQAPTTPTGVASFKVDGTTIAEREI